MKNNSPIATRRKLLVEINLGGYQFQTRRIITEYLLDISEYNFGFVIALLRTQVLQCKVESNTFQAIIQQIKLLYA